MLLFVAVASFAESEPLSEADLKNLLAGIRQNRTTRADFQEQRMIRLMKKPVVSSGTVWFQPPNKFRREVKGNSPSITVSDGRQLWIYYPDFKSTERRKESRESIASAGLSASCEAKD
jgi:outer membrane lipoprotein-sorting protein